MVTTGCPHSGWEAALPALRQLGYEEAGDTFANWYDELFQEAGITDMLQLDRPLQPNHGLAEKAMALHSDEPDAPLLWADSRGLWLLDFWAKTLPQARFLLLYTRAQSALAYALRQGADPAQFLAAWQAANRQLMLFQRRHRSRSLLLDAEATAQHPKALADACQRLGHVQRPANPSPTVVAPVPALERLLAGQFVHEQPAIQVLQMELKASAQPLGETTPHEPPQPSELYHGYRQWHAQIEKLTKALDEQTKLAADRHAQLTEAGQAQETQEAVHKETEQENELLLVQLHQVQEELECYFLKYQELAQKSQTEQGAEEDKEIEGAAAADDEARTYFPTEVGQEYFFSTSGIPRNALYGDWSYAEDEFTWIEGNRVGIAIRLPKGRDLEKLSLNFQMPPSLLTLGPEIKAHVNGILLSYVHPNKLLTGLDLDLTNNQGWANGNLYLEIECNKSVRIGEDIRDLSLRMQSVVLYAPATG